MKFFLLNLFAFFLLPTLANCQGIHFEKDSLPVLIEKARRTDKPIMIFLDATPVTIGGREEHQRNIMNDASVTKKLEDAFICYSAAFATPASRALAKKYNTTVYPFFIFLNSNGVLVYRTYGFFAVAGKYLEMADFVLNILKTGNNIASYSMRYQLGERSKQFLWDYITAREKLGYYDNSNLVNDYVDQLTPDEVITYQQMLFILQAGPAIGSKALQLCYQNRSLRDSVYRTQPKTMASAFNTRTTQNTLDIAIAKKDRDLAFRGATFLQGAYGKNYIAGERALQNYLMGFSKAINDTTAFLQQATYFYDRYYMNISVDSAQRFQQKRLDSLKTLREKNIDKYKDSSSARLYYPPTQNNNPFADALNTGAWDVYKTGTHNNNYLAKAAAWAKRSVDIEPGYHNHDTYARLLYQMGAFAEAIGQEEVAITLADEKKAPKETIAEFKDALSKIKKRKL